MEYINKTALVAEIERRIKEHHSGYLVCLKDILSFLDTIEVKEIDFEKEINKYISDNFFGSETMGFFANRTKEEPNGIDIVLCAKHFFELGMSVSNKAQKGELTNVFKYVVKMCDRLINNGNYEADAYTQDTVEDIAELCNRILDGDYGKLVEVKEVQEEPVSDDLGKAAEQDNMKKNKAKKMGGYFDGGILTATIGFWVKKETTYEDIINELYGTYKKKNSDYGNSFAETIEEFGFAPAIAKINDKVKRMKNLVKGKKMNIDESLRDNLMDVANYCIMSVVELDNERDAEE